MSAYLVLDSPELYWVPPKPPSNFFGSDVYPEANESLDFEFFPEFPPYIKGLFVIDFGFNIGFTGFDSSGYGSFFVVGDSSFGFSADLIAPPPNKLLVEGLLARNPKLGYFSSDIFSTAGFEKRPSTLLAGFEPKSDEILSGLSSCAFCFFRDGVLKSSSLFYCLLPNRPPPAAGAALFPPKKLFPSLTGLPSIPPAFSSPPLNFESAVFGPPNSPPFYSFKCEVLLKVDFDLIVKSSSNLSSFSILFESVVLLANREFLLDKSMSLFFLDSS